MSVLKGNLQVTPQEIFTSSTTQQTDLGAYATSGDGRVFRYALAGATALVPGNLVQASAEDTTNLENLAIAAAAAATKTITVTGSINLTTANKAGGFVAVTTAAGFGYTYKIASSAFSGGSFVITLEDPIIVALTASSKIDLIPSQYNGLVANPTTATSAPVGAAVFAIPAANYGWVQTHGPVNLTASSAIGVGAPVVASGGTAGQVTTGATFSGGVVPGQVGTALTGIAANESGLVFLNID